MSNFMRKIGRYKHPARCMDQEVAAGDKPWAPPKRPSKEQRSAKIASMRHAYAATLGIDLRTADRKQRERVRQEAPAWFAGRSAHG